MDSADQVGRLATRAIDLIERLQHLAETVVAREDVFVGSPTACACAMQRGREDTIALAKLLTEAIPAERTRIEEHQYDTDYGTRLDFSEPNYHPGELTSYAYFGQPNQSVFDELDARERARPKAWLHSARATVLSFAAEFWDLFYGSPSRLELADARYGEPPAITETYFGRALDLPSGATLTIPVHLLNDRYRLRSWAKSVVTFPRLLNAPAVKVWIAREKPPAVKEKQRISKQEAEIRARKALKGRPPKGKWWSAETLRKAIGCAKGQVPNLPAWQEYSDQKRKAQGKKPAATRAVRLTDGVLANEGHADAELQRLTEEQAAEEKADERQYPQRPKV